MNPFTSPEIVVQRQLDAYNAKDLDALIQSASFIFGPPGIASPTR